jgi:glycosyltransferase involved in cell wall biosynthesis
MHIGVFLSDIPQWSGGGYTFVHDVAEAFLRVAGDSRHRFSLLAPETYVAQVRGQGLPTNVEAQPLRPARLLDRGISLMRHYWPVAGLVLRRPSRLERLAERLRLDLIWFVGGLNETPEIPFITTVWDVQHRTHPWFPEVSAQWKWDHRELFLSRHLRRAAAVIVGTKVGRDELMNFYGLPESRIIILPHPTPAFALRGAETDAPPAGPPTPENFILYPAQFWAHKNHANLLRAFKVVVDEMDVPPSLVLTGRDLGNQAYVRQCASELGIGERVLFPGFVSVDEMVWLYRRAQALVYPSLSGPENLPPLEAFALGCPVAASNYPGASEQFEDAALLFDPADPKDMAQTILRILTDFQLRRKLVEKGIARARRWTAEDFVRALGGFFDRFEAQRRCWP